LVICEADRIEAKAAEGFSHLRARRPAWPAELSVFHPACRATGFGGCDTANIVVNAPCVIYI